MRQKKRMEGVWKKKKISTNINSIAELYKCFAVRDLYAMSSSSLLVSKVMMAQCPE